VNENALYYGDNLEVMRLHVKDESIDLVYLDPPFNSNATYNVLFDTRTARALIWEARPRAPRGAS
jgi:16S rRNA G966 N2-methylase RsmD